MFPVPAFLTERTAAKAQEVAAPAEGLPRSRGGEDNRCGGEAGSATSCRLWASIMLAHHWMGLRLGLHYPERGGILYLLISEKDPASLCRSMGVQARHLDPGVGGLGL